MKNFKFCIVPNVANLRSVTSGSRRITWKITTFGIILIFTFCTLNLTGCATFGKKDLDYQALKNQARALEIQLTQKDEEITDLREALSKQIEKNQQLQARLNKTGRGIQEIKSRPNTKQIQTALKNAGYNPGPIDGKMGKRTREAIRAFQEANGLKVDGRVGKKTWGSLKKYLYEKSK